MVHVISVHSFSEFTNVVEQLSEGGSRKLWYRGQKHASWSLSPTLFRSTAANDFAAIARKERELIEGFYFDAGFYSSRSLPKNGWELLFLMQHYAVPTRLLDWTESPYAGLYFALKETGTESCAIWVLEPKSWNRHVWDIVGSDKIYTINDREIENYCPLSVDLNSGQGIFPNSAAGRDEPIAIVGPTSNPRIVAQKGRFTVFGRKSLGLEQFLKVTPGTDKDPLVKIVIPHEQLQNVRQVMMNFGFTHATFFPDLEGLAKDLRAKAGYADV